MYTCSMKSGSLIFHKLYANNALDLFQFFFFVEIITFSFGLIIWHVFIHFYLFVSSLIMTLLSINFESEFLLIGRNMTKSYNCNR